MIQLLTNWFEVFAAETGILGELRYYQELGPLLLGILAVLLCFLGVRSFHLVTAGALYIGVILLSCVLLRDRMAWGKLTVFFSITGFILAFMGFQWKRAGAVVTSALAAVVFGGFLGLPAVAMALCGILGGVLAAYRPGVTVCGATAAFGGVLLAALSPVRGAAGAALAAALVLAGLGVQLLLAKRQGALSREGAGNL